MAIRTACLMALLGVVMVASAGTLQLESQSAVVGGNIVPSVSGYFSNGGSVSTFFLVGEKYAEGYVSFGRSTTFGDAFIAAGVGLGVEQTPNGFGRMTAASVFAKLGDISFLSVVEHGSGLWYKSHLKWQLVPQVSVGILAQRYAGIGPRVDVRIPRTPLTVWGAALRDKEFGRNGGIVAVTSSF